MLAADARLSEKKIAPCRENAAARPTDFMRVGGDKPTTDLMAALAWSCRSPP